MRRLAPADNPLGRTRNAAIAFDFSQRADLARYPERMDQPCSYEDLRACLRSIASVNRLTRAYHPTLRWLDYVYQTLPRQTRPLHIVDIGSGYGDMLRRIHRWAADRKLPVKLTGIDLNLHAVRAAREATLPGTVTYLSGSVFDYRTAEGIDLVISSLVMHHLQSPEIVAMLRWMEANARLGWFINDLHRQPLPYHLFRTVCRVMPWHPFVRHDGPVSILRSFRHGEWHALLSAAGIPLGECQVRTWRPARLCVARLRSAS